MSGNTNLQAIKQRFGIIGRSLALDNALDTAIRVANTDLTVLITGESGVGKEVFSRIIHTLSNRKHNQFIAINCGAIPEGTINSELFGHEKGSFTGATGERKGYFETVDGGTIFLDEIGEMPLDTQAYLLRILESGEFIRVGSSKTLKTNVRVIAATNVDLLEKVRKGRFREDLYYRLNTVPIKVPSLSERREDIYMLFRKFANDFAEKYRAEPIFLEEEAQHLLENYSWPGNIRELKNVAEQISVLATDRKITAAALIKVIPTIAQRNLPMATATKDDTTSFQEREILYKLLFDMKNDLNDLKSLVFELIKSNNLNMPDITHLKQYPAQLLNAPSFHSTSDEYKEVLTENASPNAPLYNINSQERVNKPFIIDNTNGKGEHHYDKMEVVEESLSLEDQEREMIRKALKKHGGRRKDAALDLGISERTLYRKIKQYDL